MELATFAARHVPALERDAARHNLILGLLERAADDPPSDLRIWSCGAPGQCALQTPGHPIVLGDLERAQCVRIAEKVASPALPGVVGPDETAVWFAERAEALGLAFEPAMPQQVHALAAPPRYPDAPGSAQEATEADTDLLAAWLAAFHREAIPHDAPPSAEAVRKWAASERVSFWVVGGAPVAMAAIARQARTVAAINSVYTPPGLRGRGYGGAVTAAVAARIFARGKAQACLYTDLRNPASNRCYAKVGFVPVCASTYFPRRL